MIISQPSLTWNIWSSVHLEKLSSQGSQDPVLSWDSLFVSGRSFQAFFASSPSLFLSPTVNLLCLARWHLQSSAILYILSRHENLIIMIFFTTHTVIRSGFESSALYIQSPSSVSLIECLTGHKSNLKLPASILTSSPDPLRPHSLSKADSISPVDWVKSLSISDSSPFSWSKLNLWEENLTWPLAVSNFS